MEKSKFRFAIIQKKPEPSEGIAVLRPRYTLSTSRKIARELITQTNNRDCITIGRHVTVFSSGYLQNVRNLDPLRRRDHMVSIAESLRSATAVVYQRADLNRNQP